MKKHQVKKRKVSFQTFLNFYPSFALTGGKTVITVFIFGSSAHHQATPQVAMLLHKPTQASYVLYVFMCGRVCVGTLNASETYFLINNK